MVTWKDHLNRAVAIVGSQAKLARALNCSQSKISWLLTTAEKIDAEDAVAIEATTHGDVSKRDLRPDLFGEGPQAPAHAEPERAVS